MLLPAASSDGSGELSLDEPGTWEMLQLAATVGVAP